MPNDHDDELSKSSQLQELLRGVEELVGRERKTVKDLLTREPKHPPAEPPFPISFACNPTTAERAILENMQEYVASTLGAPRFVVSRRDDCLLVHASMQKGTPLAEVRLANTIRSFQRALDDVHRDNRILFEVNGRLLDAREELGLKDMISQEYLRDLGRKR